MIFLEQFCLPENIVDEIGYFQRNASSFRLSPQLVDRQEAETVELLLSLLQCRRPNTGSSTVCLVQICAYHSLRRVELEAAQIVLWLKILVVKCTDVDLHGSCHINLCSCFWRRKNELRGLIAVVRKTCCVVNEGFSSLSSVFVVVMTDENVAPKERF